MIIWQVHTVSLPWNTVQQASVKVSATFELTTNLTAVYILTRRFTKLLSCTTVLMAVPFGNTAGPSITDASVRPRF